MMANEERLALILEANDKASAILQKVRKEIEATDNAAGKGRKGTSELGNEFDKLSDGKLVKSARAMSSIALRGRGSQARRPRGCAIDGGARREPGDRFGQCKVRGLGDRDQRGHHRDGDVRRIAARLGRADEADGAFHPPTVAPHR
jgi:hypothetical protein